MSDHQLVDQTFLYISSTSRFVAKMGNSQIINEDNLHSSIDPGFINHRKCTSIFGGTLTSLFDLHKKTSDEWLDAWENNRLFVQIVMELCRHEKAKTLSEILYEPVERGIFASFEIIKSNKNLFRRNRIRSQIILPNKLNKKVLVEISNEHFISSTLKSYLGGEMEEDRTAVVMIGEVNKIADDEILVHPLIIGFPVSILKRLQHAVIVGTNLREDEYEYFTEEIDEFSKCREVPFTNDWQDYMRKTPEEEIKQKFCKLLGDLPRKDWGGELCDHISENVHLNGNPTSAAFVFKGPAQFRAMTVDLLGKRGDQLYRLAQTPAKLLIVQHCHFFTEAVLATLRAFSTSPINPRKYCFISGFDTYRILKAYDLL